MNCSRYIRGKNCQREAKYTIQTVGYDFEVCWLHRITNPFKTLIGNIRIKRDFKKYNVGIDYPIFADVFQKRKVD